MEVKINVSNLIIEKESGMEFLKLKYLFKKKKSKTKIVFYNYTCKEWRYLKNGSIVNGHSLAAILLFIRKYQDLKWAIPAQRIFEEIIAKS